MAEISELGSHEFVSAAVIQASCAQPGSHIQILVLPLSPLVASTSLGFSFFIWKKGGELYLPQIIVNIKIITFETVKHRNYYVVIV